MIDTFQITDAEGNLCSYDDAWESLRGGAPRPRLRAARGPRTRAFTRPPGRFPARWSRLWNSTTKPPTHSRSSISRPKDRVGLLYRVTKTLFDLNLDIGSAKIVTEGARALDSFYVRTC